jgi:hypothetical protein
MGPMMRLPLLAFAALALSTGAISPLRAEADRNAGQDILRRSYEKFATFKSWSYETKAPRGLVTTKHSFLRTPELTTLLRTETWTLSQSKKTGAIMVMGVEISLFDQEGFAWLLHPKQRVAIEISGLRDEPERGKLRRRTPPSTPTNMFDVSGTVRDLVEQRTIEGIPCYAITVVPKPSPGNPSPNENLPAEIIYLISVDGLFPCGVIEYDRFGKKLKEQIYHSFAANASGDPTLYTVPDNFTQFFPRSRNDFKAAYAQMRKRDEGSRRDLPSHRSSPQKHPVPHTPFSR